MTKGEPGITQSDSYALEHTPTWAVAAVCIVFIALSLLMQRGLQRLGTWLLSSHKKSLYEALEKLKEELMLLGFISLLLTAAQNPMSRLCMPASWANQMLPCHFSNSNETPPAYPPYAPTPAVDSLVHRRSTLLKSDHAGQLPHIRKMLNLSTNGKSRRALSGNPMTSHHSCSAPGHIPVLSTESLHQLHIFIFVMAVVHVFYSCFTMLFGFTQLRKWRKWEEETNVDNYNYTDEIRKSFNEEVRKIPFRKMGFGSLTRQSTFVTSRTMTPWSTNTYGIWFNSFFRQFRKSVAKSDYLTLRLGFIENHNAPMHLNFHNYIMNSLEDDLKTVIGISGYLWVFVIFFMILNVHGWYAYFWMSFIPVLINLVIGTKLQHIITQLAMETAHAHGIMAAPIKPRDELFWFNNPHVLLYLIHFVLFQNAFELAFCIWLVTTFGFNSCFFDKHGFIISRVIVGILAQVLCSYSTLPLYALVSQMGSHYKKAIFANPVSNAVVDWRNKAKANIRHLRQNTSQHGHRKSCEHDREAEGSNSSLQSNDHDHQHVQHHDYNSTLLVTSDTEALSRTHFDNSLTHPANNSKSFKKRTKTDLVTNSPKRYCVECERLSLALHMDLVKSDNEETMDPSETSEGSTFAQKTHLLGSSKVKTVYVTISSEETIDGFPHWSLECNECKSLRTLTIESNLLRDNEENLQLLVKDQQTPIEEANPKSPKPIGGQVNTKKKSIFLKMPSASGEFKSGSQGPTKTSTPRKTNASKRPTLDRMRRLPSREIREMRAIEGTHGLDNFRPDLDIPELMLCTAMVNEPRGVELAKSTSFTSRSRMAVASSSTNSSNGEAPIVNEIVGFSKSDSASFTSTLPATSSSHHEGSSEQMECKESASFVVRLPLENSIFGDSKGPIEVIELPKLATFSSPRVVTTDVTSPNEERRMTTFPIANFLQGKENSPVSSTTTSIRSSSPEEGTPVLKDGQCKETSYL